MTRDSRFRNYLAGVSTGSVRMFLHVLVGLWLTPFTLSYLNREEFAVFSLTLDVLGWLMLLDLGITAGLRVQASRLAGQPKQELVNRLASTAFFAQNVIVLVVLACGIGLALVFPYFFPINAALSRDATWVMVLSVLGVATSIGSQTFSALLVANQQMHVDNLIGVLLIAIRTVLTVVLLKMGWGIYSLAVAHLAARVTTAVLAMIRTYRILPGLQIKSRFASWDVFKQIGSVGLWFSFGSVAGLVIHSLDTVVTAKVVSIEAVTALVLTMRFYELTSGLVFLISENARPMLGQMFGRSSMEEGLLAYRRLFSLSAGLAAVAAFAVWSGNGSFVTRWVGAVNYGGKYLDLALALSMIASLWVMPNRVVLSANLAVRGQSLVRILEGGLKLALSVWFGKMFGVVGVVAATVLASLLTSTWLLPLLTARMFKRPFWSFVWTDAAPVVLLMALLFPVALMARGIAVNVSGFPGAALGATVTGFAGMGLMWWLLLDRSMRERVPIRWAYGKAFAGLRTIVGNSAR
jgi:O-antigen/teichoic acid export membrane protein